MYIKVSVEKKEGHCKAVTFSFARIGNRDNDDEDAVARRKDIDSIEFIIHHPKIVDVVMRIYIPFQKWRKISFLIFFEVAQDENRHIKAYDVRFAMSFSYDKLLAYCVQQVRLDSKTVPLQNTVSMTSCVTMSVRMMINAIFQIWVEVKCPKRRFHAHTYIAQHSSCPPTLIQSTKRVTS